jgi:hypothetical protein
MFAVLIDADDRNGFFAAGEEGKCQHDCKYKANDGFERFHKIISLIVLIFYFFPFSASAIVLSSAFCFPPSKYKKILPQRLLGQDLITCGTTRLGTYACPLFCTNIQRPFLTEHPLRLALAAALRSARPRKTIRRSPAVPHSHHLRFSLPVLGRLLPLPQRFLSTC